MISLRASLRGITSFLLVCLAVLFVVTPSHAATYEGNGFDTCQAPSLAAMGAWGASPYRAIGIYIGGVNRACNQPNLNQSWVSSVGGEGWQFIPTYVGLQASGSSCKKCAVIDADKAAQEGKAAAIDAAAEMSVLGFSGGNPIYYDLESYPGTQTPTVLVFLSAWTSELHNLGYLSGVYASASSGITDLANASSTMVACSFCQGFSENFLEPDAVWIADWSDTTVSAILNPNASFIPAYDWQNNQRLEQYQGNSKITYGGVTLSIDNDYLDGPVAEAGPQPPHLISYPTIVKGKWDLQATVGAWSGSQPMTYKYQWKRCKNGSCYLIYGATKSSLKLIRKYSGYRLKIIVFATNVAGYTYAYSALTPKV